MSRSQSQHFTIDAANSAESSLPASRSVNDNLSTSSATTPTTKTPVFGRQDNSGSKSPKSSFHCIPHKWEQKWFEKCKCFACGKQINTFTLTLRCTGCNCRVHSDCRRKVPNNCGLTTKHLKFMVEEIMREMNAQTEQRSDNGSSYDLGESSTSANSSTPSTPAAWNAHVRPTLNLQNLHPSIVETAPKTAPLQPTVESPISSSSQLFTFPDPHQQLPSIVLPVSSDDNANETGLDFDQSNADRLFLGSEDESDHHGLNSDGLDGSQVGKTEHKWDRHAWNKYTFRNKSAPVKEEFDIPFRDIILQKFIGRGRFGEVYTCERFGEASVKFINNPEDNYETFLQDVREVKKARHDRVAELYACTINHAENKLGIIVKYCCGKPLHVLLHENGTRFDFQKVVRLASQISQGMSYIHNRKLFHKDLRSKNIMITPNNSVYIMDYGLFNVKMLAKPSRKYTIITPCYWLRYLAPELIQNFAEDFRPLPFSEMSDVYAFGTIFYELLACDFPFPRQSPDTIIWQVGMGIKPSLGNLSVCREAKNLLFRCWQHKPHERVPFNEICKLIEKFPMKYLCRSPSNPLC